MARDTQLFMFEGGTNEVRERIRRLRLVRGWDQAELAKKSGIAQAKISQIELGRVSPTLDQIESIANALGYSAAFVNSTLGLIPTTRPWLRAYADASKRETDARTAMTSLAAEYVRRLRLKPLPELIPHFDGSLDDDDAIEDFASELRLAADIEPGAVVTNAMRAAERLGCVVLPLESELGKHLGMSVRADELPIMCVAKHGVPGDRQRLTVAHELGHLALHANVPPPRDAREARRMERQAQRFASAFLCPAEVVEEAASNARGTVTLRVLAEMKTVWGIAIKALVHRFNDLGYINDDEARSLYKQISARKWSKSEPVHVPKESAQWFERTLTRKAETDDLAAACKALAAAVGGRPLDLHSFADWSEGSDAEIVQLADRRRN
jgi:Zn-dependent peptidase ImmA (M78 family)/DNA-binding XRE family transcriptional regulator